MMDKIIKHEYGIIFWAHLVIVIVIFYASFFLFNWMFVFACFALYYLQLYIAKGCILTKKQFGETGDTFYHHYLSKLGVRASKEKISFVVDFIIIPALFALTLYWQIGLNKQPLLF